MSYIKYYEKLIIINYPSHAMGFMRFLQTSYIIAFRKYQGRVIYIYIYVYYTYLYIIFTLITSEFKKRIMYVYLLHI